MQRALSPLHFGYLNVINQRLERDESCDKQELFI